MIPWETATCPHLCSWIFDNYLEQYMQDSDTSPNVASAFTGLPLYMHGQLQVAKKNSDLRTFKNRMNEKLEESNVIDCM